MAKKVPIWGWIGILLIIVCIILLLSSTYFKPNYETQNTSQNGSQIPISLKEKGIGDYVNVGELSFHLVNVTLFQRGTEKYGFTDTYTLWWEFIVTNTGKNMNYIYDCGKLLGNYQYDLRVTKNGVDITDECLSYEIVPGARFKIEQGFRFSNESSGLEHYPDTWEEFSSPTISYFSQQNQGLVKFVINSKDIIYTHN